VNSVFSQFHTACGFANHAAPEVHCHPKKCIFFPSSCFFLLLTLFSANAQSQHVELTSPIENYVRTGRCSAIQISGDGLGGGTLTLSGQGIIPIQVPITAGRVDAAVPLMSQGEPPAELSWSDGAASGTSAVSPRILGADERLVVVAGDPADTAGLLAELFPGKRAVLVHLDLSRSRLLHPAMAFESVDAVLLDLSSAARMDESQLRTLLGAGTAIAIDSPRQPIAGWPWRQLRRWWVLQHDVGGPRSGAEPEINKPTQIWNLAWPESMRSSIVLTAAIVSILIVGVTLLRPRILGVIGALAICIAVAVWAAIYGARLPSTIVAGGEVLLSEGALTQRDRYTYVAARKETIATIPAAEGITKPVLWQRRPIAGLSFRLICAADGAPDHYESTMPANFKVAFLSRLVSVDAPPTNVDPHVTAPIGLFADQLYPGKMLGQTTLPPADASQGQWWGTVVMRRG
jgi:hypothetical protein